VLPPSEIERLKEQVKKREEKEKEFYFDMKSLLDSIVRDFEAIAKKAPPKKGRKRENE